jgi:hypothetical protein
MPDNNKPFRINLTETPGEGGEWAKALADLQSDAHEVAPATPGSTPIAHAGTEPTPRQNDTPATPAPPVGIAPPTPLADSTERPLSKYEELIRTPSMKMEKADLGVITEFSQVIGAVNVAARALDDLDKRHPDQIPERMINLCRDNLRETGQVMLRELQALRHGRVQKKYDKRCVCVQCHSVFMVPLPADGICDACRASMVPRSAPY